MIIELEGVGKFELPDGTSKQEAIRIVQEYLGSKQPQAPQTPRFELLEQARQAKAQPFAITDTDVGRQLGLTARAGVTGALGLPALASDALVSLVNKIGGANIPMPSQAQQQLMTRAGLPEAETDQEKRAQDISSAIAGVLGGAGIGAALPARFAAPKELLTQSPVFQATSAGAGALGSALAREEGMGPYEQLGLGVLAGTVAPSAGTAAIIAGQAAGRGGRELVRPLTEAGREKIAGEALRAISRDPERAIQRIEEYQQQVPGYTPTTPQASQDIGMMGAFPAVKAMDPTGKFTEQFISANEARMKILNRMAKDKKALDAAEKRRDEITDPIREKAFAESTVTPEEFAPSVQKVINKIDEILDSDKGRSAPVRQAMALAKAELTNESVPIRNPADAYYVRKTLNLAAQGKLDQEKGIYRLAGGELKSVIRELDNVIESAAPGYRDYMQKYAKISEGINRLESAQTMRDKARSTTPLSTDPQLSTEYAIARPQFIRAVRDLQDDPKIKLSKTQIALLQRVARDLDESSFERAKQPGSNTFANFSIANILGNVVGKQMIGNLPATMTKGIQSLDWLYRGPDDKIRELIVDAMLDPKMAARMMRSATSREMIPVSEDLKKRALKLGYGQVFGLTEE
jgi:hypothetical protein